jgi:hypothetical protein
VSWSFVRPSGRRWMIARRSHRWSRRRPVTNRRVPRLEPGHRPGADARRRHRRRGAAGLSAAVYGASEGFDVLVFESNVPGGQAGSSSRIENYLGFPTGISGLDLTARAYAQAQKFGARIMIAKGAARLT